MADCNYREIVEVTDWRRWNQVLDETCAYDFYHLPAYHHLVSNQLDIRAILFVYRQSGYVIAFPILLRELPEPLGKMNGRRLMDATSVYGYSGPVASSGIIPQHVIKGFWRSFNEFLESQRVICIFSRLHPLLTQAAIVGACGQVIDVGVTLSIDLTQPVELQLSNYRKGHRQDIQRLRKLGIQCREAGIEHLDDFIRVYQETMDRVNADRDYYFDKCYFEHLLNDMSDIMHLFVCKDGETTICSGIFSVCRGIIQYHLSGSSNACQKIAPTKLMLDEVRNWGMQKGAKKLHLGGGVGAKRDSLYEFKAGFGGLEHKFCVWRHIVNPAVYEEVCREAFRIQCVTPDASYFPLYRHPVLQR